MNLWRVPIDEASGGPSARPAVTTPSTWSGWISFARDGSRLAFADLDDRATVWTAGFDARAEKVLGSARRVLRARGILSIDWSPDAAALAFTQRGQPWETLGVVKADGSGLAASPRAATSRACRPGRRTASASPSTPRAKARPLLDDPARRSGLQRISKPGSSVVYPPGPGRIPARRRQGRRAGPLRSLRSAPVDPAGPGVRVGTPSRDSSKPGTVNSFLPYGWSPDGRLIVGEQHRSFSGALYGRRVSCSTSRARDATFW